MAATEVRRTTSIFDNPASIVAQFHEATNGQNSMNVAEFMRATGCKSDIFALKLFESIDSNHSGDITLGEFLDGLNKLRSPNIDERIQFVFGIFDLDGDGAISGEELKTVVKASVEEDGGIMTESETEVLVESLLQLFGTDSAADITYEEFAEVIRAYPDLLRGLTFGRFGMRTASAANAAKAKRFRRIRKAASWVINNPQCLFTYTSVIIILLGCFFWRFGRYSGSCDGVDMDMRDPLTNFTRHEVVEMVEASSGMYQLRKGDEKYMVYSKEMAAKDPIECRDARKRMLMSWTLPIAKGCGQAMKATFTLILFPVSRNLMTTLRDTSLKHFFLFDEAIEFHRFLGKVGFWLAWTHTICHVVDVMNWRDPERYRYWSWAFPEDRDLSTMSGIKRLENGTEMFEDSKVMTTGEMVDGLPSMLFNDESQPTIKDILASCVALTGIILITIYTFAALFAFDYPKKLSIFKPGQRNGQSSSPQLWILAVGRWLNDFNNFWYSHHLFSVFYMALLFHPLPNLPDERSEWGWSDSWLWVCVPVIIYLSERAVRVKRSTGKTRVVGADLLEGNVVGLRFLRPRGFKYTPGQYVFIKCPQISRFEWHPFTLTSCPGDSYLGVHVRKAGDWTGALHQVVEEHTKKRVLVADGSTASSGRSKYYVKPVLGDEFEVVERFNFTISVDGPFGAPAQNYADYKILVLIGAGIGVTPFASVLTDLLDSLKQCACPKCGYSNPHHMRQRIRKVYFYWTVRSRSEASWFKHLLEAISLRDEDGLLDIHINITGIKKANDLRTMLLSLAQYESGEGSSSDAHTRTITRFGRIDWNEIFDKVKIEFPAEPTVGVFYCGPNTIAKILDKMCRKNSRGPTKFLFMQESFG